jgi:hypothetical protein
VTRSVVRALVEGWRRKKEENHPARVGPHQETDIMLPCQTTNGVAVIDRPAWAAELSPGNVVAMTIPSRGRRRPDPEPHLVLDVIDYGEGPAAVLAPALPATGGQTRRDDIYLTADDLAGVRGLHGPHVCLTARRLIVPLTHRGLAEAAFDGTPVLGLLARPALRRVHRARARLGAERAVAEQRRRRRYLAGRDAVRDEDFTVVARRPARSALCLTASPQKQRNGEGRA